MNLGTSAHKESGLPLSQQLTSPQFGGGHLKGTRLVLSSLIYPSFYLQTYFQLSCTKMNLVFSLAGQEFSQEETEILDLSRMTRFQRRRLKNLSAYVEKPSSRTKKGGGQVYEY